MPAGLVRPVAIATVFLVACGGSGTRSLPPNAPMPDGPGWVGHWSTNLGTIELAATADLDVAPELKAQLAASPFAGRYALDRAGAQVEGALTCNAPTDNHLYCTWDDNGRSGPMVLVMNPDGASFVANWGSRDGTIRLEGQRVATQP